jgi:phenylalanyl-tRNA synthetase beta chain
MQILIPDSWLREFVETEATPKQIQEALSLCGPSVERLHKKGHDFVYDIEVTTNRVDMMSVVGIAKECAAILPRFGYKTKLIINNQSSMIKGIGKVDYLNVQVDKNLCSRFTTALIENVKVNQSPKLVRDRLELCGIRAINSIVDISNYLMLEMGQPVHTFDYDKINKKTMILRLSKKGERITTLDKKEFTLPGGDIVIEDGSGKLIDLCGIMGGFNSSVDENTKNVLLFVQTYNPSYIRKTSMTLAQRTNAAVLFEKCLAIENVLLTLERGIEMFGRTNHPILDILNAKETIKTIKLGKIDLGVEIKPDEIKNILESLGFRISNLDVSVPWWRKLDIDIHEDLVEEVARIYGYHNLPSRLMAGPLPTPSYDKTFYWEQKIKNALSHWGFTETYTYSLVDKDSGLKLKNPFSSEWEYLRTNLTNSHLKIIEENLGRVPELNFFEIANVYLPHEELHLILSTTNPDYSRFKGIIEALFLELEIKHEFKIQNIKNYLLCEINLENILKVATGIKKFTPISKFTPVIEDINIKLTESYEKLTAKIKSYSKLINSVEFVDVYEQKLTLRINFHNNNKQLSKEDITPIREKILKELG